MGVNSLGPRKIAKLAKRTGLDVVRAWACGGSDHRLVLLLRDGSGVEILKDGTVTPISTESIPR
jgi:hypothetical protein